jgi:transcriptional regulator with GAF, ATPase, and Fis domain
MADEEKFFREVTLRICGSLEIEKALLNTLIYIREYIPADTILLNIYHPGIGIIETIAKADIVNGGEATSIKTPVPSITQEFLEQLILNPNLIPQTDIVEQIGGHPIMAPLSMLYGGPNANVLFMRPKLEGKVLGNISISNNLGEKYSKQHMKWVSLLNEPFAIALSNYARYRQVLHLKNMLLDDNRYLQNELRSQIGEKIIGANFGLKQVMNLVRKVAPLTSPVLLLGETGTGKELIASAIHNLSSRKEGPFIKVNCGAIPETLMDSELFGHEKGAFTGAHAQKRGRFERAHSGTIFLDEIGELTPGAQLRLLRVLQEKEIERVGGTESIQVDIRIIAATHRNLEAMLVEGQFREDLYFRLRVFPILIPPLRDRLEDIPELVHYFIQKKAKEMGLPGIPTLAPGAIDKLRNYHWPGNVRELQNAVERALILNQDGILFFNDILEAGEKPGTMKSKRVNEEESLSLDQIVSREIRQALEKTKGRVGGEKGAASLLHMNPSTLRKKMRKLNISFGRRSNILNYG